VVRAQLEHPGRAQALGPAAGARQPLLQLAPPRCALAFEPGKMIHSVEDYHGFARPARVAGAGRDPLEVSAVSADDLLAVRSFVDRRVG
jgi:hypothetical protein